MRKKVFTLLTAMAISLTAAPVSAEEFTEGLAQEFTDVGSDKTADLFTDDMEENIQPGDEAEAGSSEEGWEVVDTAVVDGIEYTKYGKTYVNGEWYYQYGITGHTEELLSKEEIVLPVGYNGYVQGNVEKWGGHQTIDWIKAGSFKGLPNLNMISINTWMTNGGTKIDVDIVDSWDGITIKCPLFSYVWKFAIKHNIAYDVTTYHPCRDGGVIEHILYEYDTEKQCLVATVSGCNPAHTNAIKKEIEGYPVRDLALAEYSQDPAGGNVFNVKSVTIPESIICVRRRTFAMWEEDRGFKQLTTVIFEEGEEPLELGSDLFSACYQLHDVHLSSRIKKLPDRMFTKCPAIKRLDIPTGVEEIGVAALQGAKNLEALHIPSTVTKIADDAMDGLTKLTIIGDNGSYAQSYAIEHNIDFMPYDRFMPDVILAPADIDPSSIVQRENKLTVSLEKRVNQAEGYQFFLFNKPLHGWHDYLQKKNTTSTTVSFDMSKLKGGTYYIYCRTWKTVNEKKVYGPWFTEYKKTISDKSLKKPNAPKIKSVKVKGNTVTVTLSASSFAKGSECFMGTGKDSTRPQKLKYSRKNIKTNTVTFKNVKKGTYYVGSRSYTYYPGSTKNYSSWSNMKKIIVK